MASSNDPRSRGRSSASVQAERSRASERSSLPPGDVGALLELHRALSGTEEHADLAAIAAGQLRVLTGASRAEIAELRGVESLAVLACATAASPTRGRSDLLAVRACAPARDVIRRGSPVWLGSEGEARERFGQSPADAPEAAWAFLPLVAGDGFTSIATLAFDEARDFGPSSRSFLMEMASGCATALTRAGTLTRERQRADTSEKARAAVEMRLRESARIADQRGHLFERERFARARAEAETLVALRCSEEMERARRLVAALAHSRTEQEALATLAGHGPSAFGALGLALLLRGADGHLELSASAGLPAGAAAIGSRPRGDGSWVGTGVFRARTSYWQEARDLARRFPTTWKALLPGGATSWLGVPIGREGVAGGVLALAFGRRRNLSPDDRERLALLAEECASLLSERVGARIRRRRTGARRGPEPRIAMYLAEYEDFGRFAHRTHVLGVFSSEEAARSALQALCGRRLVLRAWIASWTVDVAAVQARVAVDVRRR